MNHHDKTEAGQTDSITFEFELRHPPAKVWRALTDATLLSEWLLPIAELHVEPGAPFTFRAPPQPGWDGVVNCRFTEIERERKLCWAWVVGDLDTLVTFTLTPSGAGTHLRIVQSGFKPHQKQNFGGARYGWNMMSGKLVALLENTP